MFLAVYGYLFNWRFYDRHSNVLDLPVSVNGLSITFLVLQGRVCIRLELWYVDMSVLLLKLRCGLRSVGQYIHVVAWH